MANENEKIVVEPTPLKSNRINKIFIYLFAGILGIAIAYALFSSSSTEKKVDPVQEKTVASSSTISKDDLEKINRDAKQDNQDLHTSKALEENASHVHNHDDDHHHDGELSHQGQAPAPVLTDEEQEQKEYAKEDRKLARSKQQEAEKELVQGERSPIFFSIEKKIDQTKEETPSKSKTNTPNDYYNNATSGSYISIIGGQN